MASRKHLTWNGKSYLIDWSHVCDAPINVRKANYTAEQEFLYNRAGKDETCLTLDQLFEWFDKWPDEMNNPPLGRKLLDFSDEENNEWFENQKGTK